MKIIIFVLCLATVAVKIRGNSDDDEMKSINECMAEVGVTGDYEELRGNGDPRLNCIMSCAQQKEGIIENGQFDVPYLKEYMAEEVPSLGAQQLNKIVDLCVNMAMRRADICDKANALEDCMEDELEKLGL